MPEVEIRSSRTFLQRTALQLALFTRVVGIALAISSFSFVFVAAKLVTPPSAVAAEDSPDAQAVDVVFVLDNSGSMRQNDPQYLTRQAVSNFARSLGESEGVEARIGVVLFDGTARLVQPLTPIASGRVDALLGDAMNALDFSGQRTNSPAGIERALYELRENGREAGRRAIVFLSDGQIDTGDSQSDYDASWWLREELADESRALGIRIFSIAFTDGADYQLMQAVAQKTRASYYRAYQADELSGVIADVVGKVAEGDFYALASADTNAVTPFQPNARGENAAADSPSTTPDVASAPTAAPLDMGSPIGLLAWMPVAVLLIAGTLLWRRQKPAPSVDALIAQAELDMDAPAAQLLDFGGQLGETGTSLPLKRGRNRIGRDKHNDIILDDDTISSEHAVIEVHDGRYWVEDRRSTNGTRVSDTRISPEQRVPLKGGDHIRFADIDLMFVLAGYVPGGATVFLDSSTSPPIGWREQKQPSTPRPLITPPATPPAAPPLEERPAAAAIPEPSSPLMMPPSTPAAESQSGSASAESEDHIAVASERERFDPAPVENLDDALGDAAPEARRAQISLLPAPPETEAETGAESEKSVEIPQSADLTPVAHAHAHAHAIEVAEPELPAEPYRECLDFHLARVEEISPAFEQFIGEAFEPEMRDALATSARELIERAQQSDEGTLCHKEYTSGAIRYVICGLTGEMDAARECYVETFGGFTRMLTEQLQSESFRRDRCEILAVLTFGQSLSQSAGEGPLPWVSLSVVPDEGQDPRIDLLSYEFLTAEERGEIEPTEHPEPGKSHSGIG